MIYDLFLFGTIWFWILGGLITVALLAEVVNEKYGWAFITLVFFGLLLFLFGDLRWSLIKEHRTDLWHWGLIYLAGGVIVSLIKWWFLVSDAKDTYEAHKMEFLEGKGLHNTTRVPEEMRETWNNEVARIYRLSYLRQPITVDAIVPSARSNKERIIGWMAYWPIVAFWSMFHDVFRRIWETIYRFVAKSYQQIAVLAFRGVDEELAFTPKPEVDSTTESPNRR